MAKDKLTPLRTKFDIEIQIDDDNSYKLVFKPVNKKTKEMLDSLIDEGIKEYEDVDSKRAKLKELIELKDVNTELLKVPNLDNRTDILMENKKYITEISSLEKEIRDIDKTSEKMNTKTENFYKTLLDECLSGEDKVKFFKAIEDMGLSYIVVNAHVNKAVVAAQEKK